ncbi:MAG: alpha/beta fold hydrolase [Sutterellaceae bacterium]|nr:alpha/beta fold hydrolase [Burkholderiaceae bacterium]MDW8428989.1 alpha/beta fold hydrolase [Sutterellaceae bacterium]
MNRTSCAFGAAIFSCALSASAVEIGPNPTFSSVRSTGPFAVSSQTISGGTSFGGATVYSPNTPGRYAIVAFCPGFTATRSSIDAMARRLASHGFIVAAMDTRSTLDQPSSRATQLIAALNAVARITTGPAAGKIDSARRIVTGHSMGGGGTLIAATNNPSAIAAAIALAPWNTSENFSGNRVPSAIIGGALDTIAPVASHSVPFYNSMTRNEKLLCVISGAGHFFPQESPPNQPASALQISWAKRFGDGDTRYGFILNARPGECGSWATTGPF